MRLPCIACLLADREFIGKDWFKYLIDKNILFRIRIKSNTQVANSRGGLVPVRNLFRHLRRESYGTPHILDQPLR